MKTVVILGAGSSADFGLPLGAELYDSALSKLHGFQADLQTAAADAFWDYQTCRRWSSRDKFRLALLSACDRPGQGIDFAPALALCELMREAPAYSIDTLAMENPEYLPLCRAMVAQLIIESIERNIRKTEAGDEAWIFAQRRIPGRTGPVDNWLHLFVSMMRNAIRKDMQRSYSFVSFNYDQVAERVMRRIWNHPSQSFGDFDTFVKFVYPHGKIDWALEANGRSKFAVATSDVVFAHNKLTRDSFAEAHEAIAEAETVISLGFHFAPENMQSLFPPGTTDTVELIYQNYDANPGLDKRVVDAGFVGSSSFHGPIAKAILTGALEELPS